MSKILEILFMKKNNGQHYKILVIYQQEQYHNENI